MCTATQRKKAQSLRRSVQTVCPGWARFCAEFFCLIKRFQRFQKPWCMKSAFFFAQLIDASWLNYSTRLGAKVRTLDSGARVKAAKKQVQNGHVFIVDLACLKTGEAVPSMLVFSLPLIRWNHAIPLTWRANCQHHKQQTSSATASRRCKKNLLFVSKHTSLLYQSNGGSKHYCIYLSSTDDVFRHKISHHSHHCSIVPVKGMIRILNHPLRDALAVEHFTMTFVI